MSVQQVRTVADLRERIAALRSGGRAIGLVPTMGALHDGHLALVRRLSQHVDEVVVSVFVNPAQFDRPDDLAAYPRDLGSDMAALAGLGTATPSLVFAPSVGEVYPEEPRATVVVRGGLTDGLCGASRPGHFDAVATVVTKFLNMVQPDVAAFGRKDRQQLQVIRQLVTDLNLPVAILGVPTVREADGVAMSSRNQRLSPEERRDARALPRALAAAVSAAREARAADEHVDVARVRAAASAALADSPRVVVDYLEAVHPQTMQPRQRWLAADDRLVIAVAAHVGPVRLIDNVEVGDLDDERALVAAVGLRDDDRRGG